MRQCFADVNIPSIRDHRLRLRQSGRHIGPASQWFDSTNRRIRSRISSRILRTSVSGWFLGPTLANRRERVPVQTHRTRHTYGHQQRRATVETLDGTRASAGIPFFALDLRNARPCGSTNHEVASDWSDVSGGRTVRVRREHRPTDAFDALLFVDATTVALMNPVGNARAVVVPQRLSPRDARRKRVAQNADLFICSA